MPRLVTGSGLEQGFKILESAVRKFINDQSGATAIEYGLIAAAMAACLLIIEPYITSALERRFNNIGSSLK
jgi:pilus assembly protein Flp/PilA